MDGKPDDQRIGSFVVYSRILEVGIYRVNIIGHPSLDCRRHLLLKKPLPMQGNRLKRVRVAGPQLNAHHMNGLVLIRWSHGGFLKQLMCFQCREPERTFLADFKEQIRQSVTRCQARLHCCRRVHSSATSPMLLGAPSHTHAMKSRVNLNPGPHCSVRKRRTFCVFLYWASTAVARVISPQENVARSACSCTGHRLPSRV